MTASLAFGQVPIDAAPFLYALRTMPREGGKGSLFRSGLALIG
jgi:hypothetical protein